VSDVIDADETTDDEMSDDADTGTDSDEASDDSGPGFGEFESGMVTLSGAEQMTYSIGDPAYTFVGAGGCGGGSFGMTVNATEADTGYTALQLSAQIDSDLDGGGTGTFEVEEISLLVATDGDLAASRSYDGPGTLVVSEHDTGGANGDLNARRMAITLDGTLSGDGDVDVAADLVWVMGCP